MFSLGSPEAAIFSVPSGMQASQQHAPDPLSPALEAVVNKFAGLVRGVGWRHRLSEAEINELMQQVRIRLWQAQGTSEQISGVPASYVYRTAV
ncbi:MAG TPA: hypothetical protein VFB61_15800, partial [Gemmatimonadales bacterium]|nr:hypothetical protein [Gemmatimonadales bacterium]